MQKIPVKFKPDNLNSRRHKWPTLPFNWAIWRLVFCIKRIWLALPLTFEPVTTSVKSGIRFLSKLSLCHLVTILNRWQSFYFSSIFSGLIFLHVRTHRKSYEILFWTKKVVCFYNRNYLKTKNSLKTFKLNSFSQNLTRFSSNISIILLNWRFQLLYKPHQ